MSSSKKKGKKDKSHSNDAREIKELNAKCAEVPEIEGRRFASLPISQRTQDALKSSGYVEMTDIQLKSIPLALAGKDVLGAAKTGSGKTLAFLIPVLEKLYRLKWAAVFGVGAVIISPTRELAYQTFEVLRKAGKEHEFSAGLIIGGKDFAVEQGLINKMNILICTPGRLLQHMDETPDFSCQDLQVLVLDEADRILDMGFEKTVNAIIDNLPRARQTLLFSATQTKSVKDLARLSLKDPEYVAVHEKDKHSTPDQLLQTVLVCELPEKMDILYSFLRTHTNDKLLVFVSSCKQVRFLYETFRRMRPGIPLMALYGKQKQMKRMAIYNDFCKKKAACLFATDIAARGLDFPAVNWVVQFDCPEDVATYIHRAGRTARYKSGGKALLMLLPSEEEGMMNNIEAAKIPITRIKVNPAKAQSCSVQFQNMCAADQEIKHLAQKSFISYARSVFLQKDKTVFDVNKLPLTEFALSLGLAKAPKIRFVAKQAKKIGGKDAEGGRSAANSHQEAASSDMDEKVAGSSGEEDSGDDENQADGDGLEGGSGSDEEDFLVRKGPATAALEADDAEEVARELEEARRKKEKKTTKAAQAKKLLNKGIANPQKVKFDEEGAPLGDEHFAMATDAADDEHGEGGINIEKVREKLRLQDKLDKAAERERVKAMHKEKRVKDRERRKAESAGSLLPVGGEGLPTVEPHYLGSGGEEDGDDSGGSSAGSASESEEEYVRPGNQKRSRGTLRRNSDSSGDGAGEEYSSDDDHEQNWGTKRSRTLEADEALALKLLGK